MIRTSILSLAFLALAGTSATPAGEPKKEETKEGFRVYTISAHCGTRRLQGVYATPEEAFAALGKSRAVAYANRVEVTTGSEGTRLPAGRPTLYEVYSRSSDKSRWLKRGLYVDQKKAEEAAKAHAKEANKVAVVHDYGRGTCSRSTAGRAGVPGHFEQPTGPPGKPARRPTGLAPTRNYSAR